MAKKRKIRRREFLHGSIVVMSAAVLSACAAPTKEEAMEEPTTTAEPKAEATAEPKAVSRYVEAPLLAEWREKGSWLMEAGELPPVEERLPVNPRVHTCYESIGEYSDTMTFISTTPDAGYDVKMPLYTAPFGETNDNKMFPNQAESLEVSEDYRTFTINMRKGLKWSDGVPYTTEDVKFWYEDDLLNTDINPTPSRWWEMAGEPPELEIVDDYSFKLIYPEPARPMRNKMLYWAGMYWNFANGTPAHFLKQYHIKYNPDVEKEAIEKGYDDWVAYYGALKTFQDITSKGVPATTPYLVENKTGSHIVFVRNPYYWGVDKEGNQLPYFDRVRSLFAEDLEMVDMKIVAGEVDFCQGKTRAESMPIYKKNAEKGNYFAHEYQNTSGKGGIDFNRTPEDLAKRKIFEDPRWSKAMSYAIDREEIKEIVYMGTGTVRQAAPNPECTFFKKEWEEAYVEYNPEKANEILDELGLDERDSDGYRLRPDGKRLTINMEHTGQGDIVPLFAKYFENVGVKSTYKEITGELRDERSFANKLDCTIGGPGRCTEVRLYLPHIADLLPDWVSRGHQGANEWYRWHLTKGESGIEPPKEWQQLFKDVEAWLSCTTDEEYIRLAHKIFDFLILDQLYFIGTVFYTLWPVIAKRDMGNIPETGWAGDDVGQSRSLFFETWYRKKT